MKRLVSMDGRHSVTDAIAGIIGKNANEATSNEISYLHPILDLDLWKQRCEFFFYL
jgi:hypothetical protein